MEIDDLKRAWATGPVNKEPYAYMRTDPVPNRFKSVLNRIRIPELVGSAICLLGAAWIVWQFETLETSLLQAAGIATTSLLIALPALSVLSVLQFQVPHAGEPYTIALQIFLQQHKTFRRLQRVNLFLCYPLLVATVVLLSGYFQSRSTVVSPFFWTLAFSLGYLFLLFSSRQVSRRYNRSLREIESLLQEVSR
ncbi:MAG: hypothetical protein K1X47_10480 [Cyclobacteriaceae bacterium]|nr:hypothetical protein [Cyclobacteriaceae bacterium]